MQNRLDKFMASENWKAARKLILSELKKDHKHHWFLTRLSAIYYQERNYKKALQISQKAYSIEPKCPLVLWDLAGALYMLDREKEAIKIYRNLIRRGVDSIAFGECGEGLARAKGLVADSYYSLFSCYQSLGAKKKAQTFLLKHISLRGHGCHSIYSLQEVKRKVTQPL